MPVKKTAAAKKAAAKKTTAKKTAAPAKRGPGRPKGSKNKTTNTAPAKKSTAKRGPGRPPGTKNKTTAAKKTSAKNVKNVNKPASKRGGFHREINPDTGFVVGTDSDLIAQALLEGGESRKEIVERMENTLELETRTGTEKSIGNMVSGVLNKMLAAGFTIESSFVVVPPTPASKRAASRKRK
jgi:hypothetical protein